jgi:hypothetical protein
MIENGFKDIGLALVAVAICLGLACILLVGVAAAVFLALGRRSPFSDDDDAGNDRQTTSTPQPPRKGTPTKMSRRAGAGRRPGENIA